MKPRILQRCFLVPLFLFIQPAVPAADVNPPRIAGSSVVNVKAFGAMGDGKTLDTDAINKAIDTAAAAGGGTVYFPAGTYASFSVHLKSNIALYLDQGATLLAADPPPEGAPGGYDPPEPNEWDQYEDFGHSHWHNSLIWGEELENVSILGPGRIFGKGLSRGWGRKDPLPGQPPLPRPPAELTNAPANGVPIGPFGYPNARDTLPAGVGNKAIALKNCRNVIFRDFTIFHGGHFAILATGVDNFTLDNLKIDTNRDGIDIDCCQNVRVSNCTVNSPADDGICPKSSFALGLIRPTENVTIVNCQVSGYEEGSLLDGTYTRMAEKPGDPTGRIKFGTEANGGFKNITIANCVFDYCRGIALEEVDGGSLEDVSINNVTMRDIVNAPIFIRLGARSRGPDNPPVGIIRRINISNVIAYNVASDQGILISGLPHHPIEDVTLSNIRILYRGGGTKQQAERAVPEYENDYPEPSRFGTIPSWGMFARHVKGLDVNNVEMGLMKDDFRPALMIDDVRNVEFNFLKVPRVQDVSTFVLKHVEDFTVYHSRPVPDARLDQVDNKSF
ncbi:MAG TPA: glycoside hydrolase family 28 protein [Verrucomicrobiae bacterium]|nr:glycoside hydrolase family 28 protein [Verrucomicrobiae bacterium]